MQDNEFYFDPRDEAPVPVRSRVRRWAQRVAERHAEDVIVQYGDTVLYADGSRITRPEITLAQLQARE